MNKLLAFLLVLATFLGQVFSIIDPGISNSREGIYNYCPSVFQTDDGTRYVYYCTNKNSYEVVDHIGCRKGVRGLGGRYKWSEEKIVLSPTENSWDAHHTCDPSVIKGDFEYNGDFALDRENNVFYAVSDCHPYPTEIPNGISDTFRVTSIGGDGVSSGEWKNISQVGKRQTHFDRNHDCGLLRDEYGSLPVGNRLSVYYTNARADAENWLWSYRIFERRIKLSK